MVVIWGFWFLKVFKMVTPTAVSAEQIQEVDKKIQLAQKKFLLGIAELPQSKKTQIWQEMLTIMKSQDMLPIYEYVCKELNMSIDASLVAEMKKNNDTKLKEMQEQLENAEKNEGETEVRDCLLSIAEFYAGIGDLENWQTASAKAEEKTAGSGIKMDIVFNQMRLEIFYGKWHEIKKSLEKARLLCDQGGDWERKNRLKVYEGIICLAVRNFKQGSELLLDSVATFTTYEIMSYEQCVWYAVVASVISQSRVDLKKKVVDSPEILSLIHQMPLLQKYLNSYYNCNYKEFFTAFLSIYDEIEQNLFLYPHRQYYTREVRVCAYTQFLEAYKSVTLKSMADTFGVSIDFLDEELCDFIVDDRLNAKIDKVSGVVETKRAESKNHLYQQVVKQGDLLLNRIQKLSKIIDVE
eukprot:TRINITY_DN1116_c0_g1_i1.p1 TRINITY_DN1116_c0_g1~~TRINITY_DN1116_c0_g1_i1.p1  ORF type:complete len:409 (-),score=46.66 TRINITY_DN1116_c0_g1_i1:179-1405(-)